MKKYRISSRYLDRCIEIIAANCYDNPSKCFTGTALSEFCSNPKNVRALLLLEAAHEIRTVTPDRNMCPAAVWLEDNGVLHSYAKREKRLSAIKGFIAGVISTVISTTVFPYLFCLLIKSFLP